MTERTPITRLEWIAVVLIAALAADAVALFVSWGMLPGEGRPNPPLWNAIFIASSVAFPILIVTVLGLIAASALRSQRVRRSS